MFSIYLHCNRSKKTKEIHILIKVYDVHKALLLKHPVCFHSLQANSDDADQTTENKMADLCLHLS